MWQRSRLISWLLAQPIRSQWCPRAASWRTNQKSPSGQVSRVLWMFFSPLFLPFLHHVFILSAVPAPVSLLSLSPSSNGSLLLSWSPPAGHWENYKLLLFDGSQQIVNTTLDWEAVNFTFPVTKLTPGRSYRALLRVESGGLTAESSCEGATGKSAAEIQRVCRKFRY